MSLPCVQMDVVVIFFCVDIYIHMVVECAKREASCCHCDVKMSFDLLDDHYRVCEEMKVSCPKNCGEKLCRGDLNVHEEKCPNVPIECPFFDAGCRAGLTRKELDKHLEESTTAHLMNFVTGYNVLKADVETLKTELKAASDKNEDLKSSIAIEVAKIKGTMEIPNSELSKSLECIETLLKGCCLDSIDASIMFAIPSYEYIWRSPSFTVSPVYSMVKFDVGRT